MDATYRFEVWSSSASVVVTEPGALASVVEIVRSGALGQITKTRVWMAADRSGLGKPADCEPPAGCMSIIVGQ